MLHISAKITPVVKRISPDISLNSFLKNSFHGVFQGRFYEVNS